jgi:bile acid:Na+ symporter, BASS family
MSPHDLVLLTVKTSVLLMIFGTALNARWSDATYLLRRPALLLRSILSMNIIVPLATLALCAVFKLNPAVEIALVALALSPVPPILPTKQLKAGGSAAYVIGLLTSASLLAIILVPVALFLLGETLHRDLRLPIETTLKIMLVTVFIPLAAGIFIRSRLPHLARRLEPFIMGLATVLLGGAFVPLAIAVWPQIAALIGNGTLAAIVAFTLTGLMTGYALGGPNSEDRVSLALASSARHPGVALAIVHVNFPEQPGAIAAILLTLAVSTVVSAIYLSWRKRQSFPTPHHAREI